MDVKYLDNVLCVKDFIKLKKLNGFHIKPEHQVKQALENGLYLTMAICENEVVGMGRLVGDGVMYWYIQDVMVLPSHQGKGIGKTIIERLITYINVNSLPETLVTVGLIAAKGKDGFYEKLGFTARPDDSTGSGMTKIFMTSIKG